MAKQSRKSNFQHDQSRSRAMAAAKKSNRNPESQRENESGGQGLKDEVGRSGLYPFTRPDTPKGAEVRRQAHLAKGETAESGYEDHGCSELTYEGGQVFGALKEGGGSLLAH